MSLFAQLLDPEVLINLEQRDIDALEAVVDHEIMSNPQIQKLLRDRVDKFQPALRKKTAGRTPAS